MRSGKIRRVVAVVVGLLVVAAVLFYLFDPDARLKGWVRGDPWFRGRSAAAWQNDLRSPDENTRAAAVRQLKEGGAEAVPVLEWVVKSGGPAEARWEAADVLGQIGPDARPAGPALVAALKDPDPRVREVTVQALGELAPDVPGAVPALVELFPDVKAIRAVAEFKEAGADAVPKLTELLTHSDSVVRWNAARTLQKIGPASGPAVPALVARMLSDPDPAVREHAAEALGPIGPAAHSAVPDLVKALDDPEPMVRRDAVRSLGEMGQAAKAALPKVQALKADPNQRVREAAEQAERWINDPSAKPGSRRPGVEGERD